MSIKNQNCSPFGAGRGYAAPVCLALYVREMIHITTYGTREKDFDSLKVKVSSMFGADLKERENSKWGVYAAGEAHMFKRIKLYPNPGYFEGDSSREDEQCHFLLEITCCSDALELGYVNSIDLGFKSISHVEKKDI